MITAGEFASTALTKLRPHLRVIVAVVALAAMSFAAVRVKGSAWWLDRPHIIMVVVVAGLATAAWWIRRSAVTMTELVELGFGAASVWSTWQVLALAAEQTERGWHGLGFPLGIASICSGYVAWVSIMRAVAGYIRRTRATAQGAGVRVVSDDAKDEGETDESAARDSESAVVPRHQSAKDRG